MKSRESGIGLPVVIRHPPLPLPPPPPPPDSPALWSKKRTTKINVLCRFWTSWAAWPSCEGGGKVRVMLTSYHSGQKACWIKRVGKVHAGRQKKERKKERNEKGCVKRGGRRGVKKGVGFNKVYSHGILEHLSQTAYMSTALAKNTQNYRHEF